MHDFLWQCNIYAIISIVIHTQKRSRYLWRVMVASFIEEIFSIVGSAPSHPDSKHLILGNTKKFCVPSQVILIQLFGKSINNVVERADV